MKNNSSKNQLSIFKDERKNMTPISSKIVVVTTLKTYSNQAKQLFKKNHNVCSQINITKKMASNNISKIVRGNLNLKPWILSKSPKDIVNSYVQKLYEQIPTNFKSNLLGLQTVTLKPAKPSSSRAVKTPNDQFLFPMSSKRTLKSSIYRSPPITAKNSCVDTQKKLLKTPNYKIYSKRTYLSSASSSCGSFVRNVEERRKKMYKPVHGVQVRTFTAASAMVSNNLSVSKYIAPKRIFNENTNAAKAMEITNAICRDLMAVDKMLKKRISVIKPNAKPSTPVEVDKREFKDISLKGWNHPSSAHLSRLTAKPVVNRAIALSENILMPVKRKPFGSKFKTLEQSPRRESDRYEVPCLSQYFGTPRGLYNGRTESVPKVSYANNRSAKTPNAIDLVCLSRAERINCRRSQQKSTGTSVRSLRRY